MSPRRLRRFGPPLALGMALLLLWQAATLYLNIQDWLLPSPLQILQAGWQARGVMGPHVWQTIQETVIGFALALLAGLTLGMSIDYSHWLRRALYPLLVLSQTVPVIAIAPLLVIWFGYGILPKVLVVGLVCFFPIVVSTADGLRSADPDQIALLRTMGASRSDVFRLIRLPGALPSVFTGIKVGITYSVVGAIMGEWVGSSRGLGVFMLRATNAFRTDWVFVSIAITAALSVLLFGLVNLVERILLGWYYASRRTEEWAEVS
ncbi:MAG: ABC transporter permease [Anaerolineae bacterium]|jgi:ABC-type nitrate/sulfonate/bicarbonate transport system permease component|nr:ABC transporter permease [Chloroflexota bacterium]